MKGLKILNEYWSHEGQESIRFYNCITKEEIKETFKTGRLERQSTQIISLWKFGSAWVKRGLFY